MQVKHQNDKGEIPGLPVFSLTKSSATIENKRYFYNGMRADHMAYFIACPKLNEIYIKMNSHLDHEKIDDFLKWSNLRVAYNEAREIKKTKIIKKGAGFRYKKWRVRTRERDVYDESNNKLLTFEGDNIVKMYLSQDGLVFGKAAKLFSDIYYRRLFYTSWIHTAKLSSDITAIERDLIHAIDNLEIIYKLFLEAEVVRDRLKRKEPLPATGLDWITEKMMECKSRQCNEMILHVLNAIDSRIDVNDFARYGGHEKETQETLVKFYGILKTIKGRFESITADASAAEAVR
jgi:hypothetical protein